MTEKSSDQPSFDLSVLFRSLATDKEGKVKASQCLDLLAFLGVYIKERDFNFLTSRTNEDEERKVTFMEFMDLIGKPQKAPDYVEEIIRKIKKYDRENSGEVTAKEVRYVMLNYIPDLTDVEVEEVMRKLNKGPEGKVKYESLRQILF